MEITTNKERIKQGNSCELFVEGGEINPISKKEVLERGKGKHKKYRRVVLKIRKWHEKHNKINNCNLKES